MDDLNALIAANLKALRLARGISQEALAHEAGITLSYYSAVELGKRNLTLQAVERMAQRLGCDVDLLVCDVHGAANVEEPPPPRG